MRTAQFFLDPSVGMGGGIEQWRSVLARRLQAVPQMKGKSGDLQLAGGALQQILAFGSGMLATDGLL